MKNITSYANDTNCIKKSSITATLRNKALQLLANKGINTISDTDYDTITNNAQDLTHSYQVTELDDITLDAIYECFNDVSDELLTLI
jgi:hypothetical protein